MRRGEAMRQLAILAINTAITVGLLTVLLIIDCWLLLSIAMRVK
jgi:hypothetical protein